jgi:hypothetical protein
MKTATAKIVKLPRAAPGTPGYRWTDAQRRKHARTCARKRAARLKEERQERRSPAKRPVVPGERIDVSTYARTATPKLRKGGPGPEERTDAIVYLSRAYAAYEYVPDEALLGLLALRTLQGRIK